VNGPFFPLAPGRCRRVSRRHPVAPGQRVSPLLRPLGGGGTVPTLGTISVLSTEWSGRIILPASVRAFSGNITTPEATRGLPSGVMAHEKRMDSRSAIPSGCSWRMGLLQVRAQLVGDAQRSRIATFGGGLSSPDLGSAKTRHDPLMPWSVSWRDRRGSALPRRALRGPSGRTAPVLTAWIKDLSGKIRLTSIYVKEARKQRG